VSCAQDGFEVLNLLYLLTCLLKGALQLLINRYGYIRFAQVPERVSTKSFVVLIIGNSKSFHLGTQGTFKHIHTRAPNNRFVVPFCLLRLGRTLT